MRGCPVWPTKKNKARILARFCSATFENFGDCEPVVESLSEMRVHVGALLLDAVPHARIIAFLTAAVTRSFPAESHARISDCRRR